MMYLMAFMIIVVDGGYLGWFLGGAAGGSFFVSLWQVHGREAAMAIMDECAAYGILVGWLVTLAIFAYVMRPQSRA